MKQSPTNLSLVRLSKLLSLMLRHKPEQFGVVLDAEGWASLAEVLAAVRTRIPNATEADVHAVVATLEQDKRRFTICEGDIRANYGHSISERILHERATPPEVLLHGSTTHAAASILQNGILPMRRQYVHLTTEHALASRVGARHGAVRVFVVAAANAHAEGVIFYRANESFWLVDPIPPRFVS